MLSEIMTLVKRGSVIVLLMSLMPGISFGLDISDVPLDAQTKAAPANIMFVLDDSGSMDWEVMTEEADGVFSGRYYIFDDPGDNLPYSNSAMTSSERLMWKSQYFGYNAMYYNPAITYEHWPTLPDADPDTPRSHPAVDGNYFNLSATFAQIFSIDADAIDITVDDTDSGFSMLSGDWYESDASPEFGGSSLYSDSTDARAQWSLDIPEADTYQVLVWWSSASSFSRDSQAQYVVNHGTETTTYTIDQNNDYGQWSILGAHAFPIGSTAIEVVRGNTGTATSADAVRAVQGNTAGMVEIPNAHYYVESETENRPYLVIVDGGSISYYAVTSVTGSGGTESIEALELVTDPPADVQTTRTYAEERQNFANWYSFYRRRELTATAAVSRVIDQMSGVHIGLSTINGNITQPVVAVKVGGVDETQTLLNALYGLTLGQQGTPLRRGLQNAGEYYHQDDGDTGGIGSCPYWAAEDGGECQQAFAIVMTDGYWNGSSPSVNNADGTAGTLYADSYSDTLADVAWTYWENDLSSSLNDLVSTNNQDPADWQHMVTYGVSFGVTGTLNPDDYDLTAEPPPNIPWTSPYSAPENHKIDDLYHASVNGRGQFLSADNPSELIESLLTIMLDIESRIGSASSVSVNGDEIYKVIDDETYMFQSSYDTVGWVGDVKSFKVDPTNGDIDLSSPEWSASSVWAGENWDTYWNNRVIATYDGSDGIPFRLASLATSQKDLLGVDSTEQQSILEYIRGNNDDQIDNGGTFRNRTSRLGDIVHSSPVYHEGLLYVGANDGMMHALIAEGSAAGEELFSYVPSQVIQNLPNLAAPDYIHKYFVDLTATVQNISLSGSPATILVGGLGQGGKGYYSLDMTDITTYNTTTEVWDPTTVTETSISDRILWEFPNATTSAADTDDIGYSFSEALIVRTNDPTHPWVVIFGNGYNSVDGQSVLFVLNPSNGAVLRKFELGNGLDNGLATPSVTDVNNDSKADYVYAGDLAGNLWKIDLTDNDISNWDVAFNDGTEDIPLFRAVGVDGQQPITSKPDVMYHSQLQGYMVIFGTGMFLGQTDAVDSSQQSVYGIWDYGDDADDLENLGTFDPTTNQVSSLSANSTLLEQTVLLDEFEYSSGGTVEEILRFTSNNTITWATEDDSTTGQQPNPSTSESNNVGWFFNLPQEGERVVSPVMIRDGRVIFISYTPLLSPCSTGGASILHELNASNGSRLSYPVFDVNKDQTIDATDQVEIEDPDNAGSYITISPTGIQRQGQLQVPAILQLSGGGNIEIKYMSSTSGTIETVTEQGVRTGTTLWQEGCLP